MYDVTNRVVSKSAKIFGDYVRRGADVEKLYYLRI